MNEKLIVGGYYNWAHGTIKALKDGCEKYMGTI